MAHLACLAYASHSMSTMLHDDDRSCSFLYFFLFLSISHEYLLCFSKVPLLSLVFCSRGKAIVIYVYIMPGFPSASNCYTCISSNRASTRASVSAFVLKSSFLHFRLTLHFPLHHVCLQASNRGCFPSHTLSAREGDHQGSDFPLRPQHSAPPGGRQGQHAPSRGLFFLRLEE